jgi:hypothetical protein
MPYRSFRLKLAAVACVLLGAVACSSSKPVQYARPSALTPSAPAAPAPTASSAAAPSSPLPRASGQLTGTALQTVLLPQSFFPAGFSLSPSSAVSSDGNTQSTPARYDLATVTCADFVQHLGNAGFGESAMAANSMARSGQVFDQLVYQFASSVAASGFVSGIRALAARCGSFTASDNGTGGTLSMHAKAAPAVGGHPSLLLQLSGKLGSSPLTLDARFTVSGADVFGAATAGVASEPPASPATDVMIYTLMKRQAAAAVLG